MIRWAVVAVEMILNGRCPIVPYVHIVHLKKFGGGCNRPSQSL